MMSIATVRWHQNKILSSKTNDDEWGMPRGFNSWKEAVRYVKRRHPDVVEMEDI